MYPASEVEVFVDDHHSLHGGRNKKVAGIAEKVLSITERGKSKVISSSCLFWRRSFGNADHKKREELATSVGTL